MPRENGRDDAEAAFFADAGTSRAVIDVTKHHGLASLSGFPFEVRTSTSTREQAGRLANRCARAYSYLEGMLAFRPRCALVVLNRGDWSERASNPSHVMPYYDAGNLFLTGEPSDLTALLEEVASSAPPAAARELDQVYLSQALIALPYYRRTNRAMAHNAPARDPRGTGRRLRHCDLGFRVGAGEANRLS